MEELSDALREQTGIQIDADDLSLHHADNAWVVCLYDHVLGSVRAGADQRPDAWDLVQAMGGARKALCLAVLGRMELSLPSAFDAIDGALTGFPDALRRNITVDIVNAGDLGTARQWTTDVEQEQGWPHFVLVLALAGNDVQVDANPYHPDAPFDLDEVARSAVILAKAKQAEG